MRLNCPGQKLILLKILLSSVMVNRKTLPYTALRFAAWYHCKVGLGFANPTGTFEYKNVSDGVANPVTLRHSG